MVPQIAHRIPDVDPAVLAEAEDAAVAVATFDQWASQILRGGADDPSGDMAPMATILLRSESAASSQIEHITVGARQLAHAELDEKASRNATFVAANVAATRAAVQLATHLDAAASSRCTRP